MRALRIAAGAVSAATGVFDIAAVFSVLQNEDGVFDITLISTAPWTWIICITAVAAAVTAVLTAVSVKIKNKQDI